MLFKSVVVSDYTVKKSYLSLLARNLLCSHPGFQKRGIYSSFLIGLAKIVACLQTQDRAIIELSIGMTEFQVI